MKTVRLQWGLFVTSCLCWAVGWWGAIQLQQKQLPNEDAFGVLFWWGLGGFFGAVWLLLTLWRIAARIWFHEKTRAAAN
jgi:hypothetical protein